MNLFRETQPYSIGRWSGREDIDLRTASAPSLRSTAAKSISPLSSKTRTATSPDEEDLIAEGVGDAPDDRLYVLETSSHTFTTAAGSSLKREGRSLG